MINQHKSEPVFNLPPVTQTLCLLNIGIFLFGLVFPQLMTDKVLYDLAFVPARYTGTVPFGMTAVTSLLTHMFLHAGWLHLSVNAGTLMAFGAGLEKNMGGRRMLVFYFATGLCGAALHTLVYPHSQDPMIGASGAISGLFGGIIMMMYGLGMMGGGGTGQPKAGLCRLQETAARDHRLDWRFRFLRLLRHARRRQSGGLDRACRRVYQRAAAL